MASSVAELQELECESSFAINITKRQFDILYETLTADNNKLENTLKDVEKDIILYFHDDSRKIPDGRIQKKINKESVRCLKFIFMDDDKDVVLLPIIRKMSVENLVQMPVNIIPKKIIVRYKLLELPLDNVDGCLNCRICIEKHSEDYIGGTYMLTGEIEYDRCIYEQFFSLSVVEDKLIDYLKSHFASIVVGIDFERLYKNISTTDLINIPSRRFGKIQNCNFESVEAVKFKYDGYKGRMVQNKNGISYYDDLHNMFELVGFHLPNGDSSKFKLPYHVVFQFEILTKRNNSSFYNTLILTDILGVYYNNCLYTCEPLDVLKYFDYLNRQYHINSACGNDTILLKTPKGTMHVKTQQRITLTCRRPNELIDGYIWISGNNEIKYKVPTIDVQLSPICKKMHRFKIGGDIYLYVPIEQLNACSPNTIYELVATTAVVSPLNDKFMNSYEKIRLNGNEQTLVCNVLRKRYDRNTPSSYEEFFNFIKEVEYVFSNEFKKSY